MGSVCWIISRLSGLGLSFFGESWENRDLTDTEHISLRFDVGFPRFIQALQIMDYNIRIVRIGLIHCISKCLLYDVSYQAITVDLANILHITCSSERN